MNAKMPDTGIEVHMHLEPRGTVVVELDKALHGCVESAALWYDDLKKTIQRDGFDENPYDRCIFN